MYTKDKALRITLRLNERQFDFVKSNADIMGVSPSEFLRIVINTTMSATKQIQNRIDIKKGEVFGRENDKTDSDYIV